jgi:hypothetical protein
MASHLRWYFLSFFISHVNTQAIVLCLQLDSVRRIFDEHRRQDISMIQERDNFQRSINQEDVDDYHECIWIYDSNLYRELLKCDLSQLVLLFD